MAPWKSCLGQAAHPGHRFRAPGATIDAWQLRMGEAFIQTIPAPAPRSHAAWCTAARPSWRWVRDEAAWLETTVTMG